MQEVLSATTRAVVNALWCVFECSSFYCGGERAVERWSTEGPSQVGQVGVTDRQRDRRRKKCGSIGMLRGLTSFEVAVGLW